MFLGGGDSAVFDASIGGVTMTNKLHTEIATNRDLLKTCKAARLEIDRLNQEIEDLQDEIEELKDRLTE